jgi:hypothetical protein
MLADDRGKKARFPGESTKDSVKTIAQGMPDDSAEPVVTAASFSICWRAMGEAVARHSLRPLSSEGTENDDHSGAQRRENDDSHPLGCLTFEVGKNHHCRPGQARRQRVSAAASVDPGSITPGSGRREGRCNDRLAR